MRHPSHEPCYKADSSLKTSLTLSWPAWLQAEASHRALSRHPLVAAASQRQRQLQWLKWGQRELSRQCQLPDHSRGALTVSLHSSLALSLCLHRFCLNPAVAVPLCHVAAQRDVSRACLGNPPKS